MYGMFVYVDIPVCLSICLGMCLRFVCACVCVCVFGRVCKLCGLV